MQGITTDFAVVGDGEQRCFWRGVDRVGRYQIGDITRIAERLILDASRRPEQALWTGSSCR
jgi:hypothetical protein